MSLKDQHIFEIKENMTNIIQNQYSKMCQKKYKNLATISPKMNPNSVKKQSNIDIENKVEKRLQKRATAVIKINKFIELKGVNFSYPESNKNALSDINVVFESDKSIAIFFFLNTFFIE